MNKICKGCNKEFSSLNNRRVRCDDCFKWQEEKNKKWRRKHLNTKGDVK